MENSQIGQPEDYSYLDQTDEDIREWIDARRAHIQAYNVIGERMAAVRALELCGIDLLEDDNA